MVRLDERQRALLEAASQADGGSASTFVLKAATETTADVVADRRVVLLDEAAWRVFDGALQGPALEVAGLSELLTSPTVLDDNPPASGAQR
ncbi:hypothetical protein GCM10027605_62340 [Micromonospora zhanjiangensis]